MVFPQTLLPIKVELYLNGVWTDITQYVRVRDSQGGIEIERGRPDEAGKITPGRCTLELDNTDLRFNPRNPTGPYYGQLGRNTPLRVSVDQTATYLTVAGETLSDARTPDNAALDILGDIDVSFHGALENWSPPNPTSVNTTELMGKYSVSANRSWFLGIRGGAVFLEWSTDGTTVLSAQSTQVPVPAGDGEMAVRAALDVNNGLGGYTVTFWSKTRWTDTWKPLGEPVVTTAGTTSIFNSNAQLRVGDASSLAFQEPKGRIYHAEVRNSAGTVVANPDFTIQTPGATSFNDAAGRTWSVPALTEISNRDIRFVGEVPSWPVDSDTSGNDVWVRISASGILRRLNQGYPQLQSALRRSIPSDPDLIAYWPMEDEAEATRLAAVTPLTRTMRPTHMNLAADQSLGGSKPLPQIGEDPAGIACTVPAGTNGSTPWEVNFMFYRSTGPTAASTVMEFRTTGVHSRTRMRVNTSSVLVECFDDDANLLGSGAVTPTRFFGEWNRVHVTGQQSGGNIRIDFAWFPADGTTGLGTNFTFAGTVGRVTSISTNFGTGLEGGTIGHVSVINDTDTNVYTQAASGYAGEGAADRIIRLCEEEGIPVATLVDQSNQVALGQQQVETVITNLDNAADSDHGTLGERRDEVALEFRDHNTVYNQDPVVTLNYPSKAHLQPPFIPVDDDAHTENDVTVDRLFGGSYQAVQTTGVLSTATPPTGVGSYQTSYDLSLFTDDQNPDHAYWRLHLGTIDEPRYPSVNVWLQHMADAGVSQAIQDGIRRLNIGDRIRIENPPTKYQNDTVDLIVDGYVEFLNQKRWEFEFNTRPASGWSVAYAGDDTTAYDDLEFNWFDTDGSTLAEDLTDTETTVDIETTIDTSTSVVTPTWTDTLGDSPYDLSVAGETMTVLGPGTLMNANPLFDTNTTGWSSTTATIAWDNTVVCPHPRAKGSAKVTPNGGAADNIGSTNTGVGTVVPSARYQASAWVYSPTGWNGFRMQVNWRNAAGTNLSTSTGAVTFNAPAGVWTLVTETFTSNSGATSQAQVFIQQTGAPAASDIWYTWAVRISKLEASGGYDEFARTTANAWGLADSGQTYTDSGGVATDFQVASGYGAHVLSTTNVTRRSTYNVGVLDVDVYCDVATSVTPTGGALFGGPVARWVDGSNQYQARLQVATTNVVTFSLIKRLAGVESSLTSYVVPIANTPGTFWRVRFQVFGSNLRAKIWPASWFAEPDVWHVTATDPDLLGQEIGARSIAQSTNTNVNPEMRYDNLRLVNPQSFSVSRSTNGVVKAQVLGAAVSLRYPPIIAL